MLLSATSEGPSFVFRKVNIRNVFIDVFSDVAEKSDAIRIYCGIFERTFNKIPPFWAASLWLEMELYLVLTTHQYNVRQNLERQAFTCTFFSKDDIAKMKDMGWDYVKRGVELHIFCYSIQLSPWV